MAQKLEFAAYFTCTFKSRDPLAAEETTVLLNNFKLTTGKGACWLEISSCENNIFVGRAVLRVLFRGYVWDS